MSLKKKNQKRIAKIFQRCRIRWYRMISAFSGNVSGTPQLMQPLHLVGKGNLIFGKNVYLGYFPAPSFYSGHVYIEIRQKNASVIFGDNVMINNNLTVICTKTSVNIGNNVLMGHDVEIIDSDFHALTAEGRIDGNRFIEGEYESRPVVIGDNVFIGSCVKILKGVTIGTNSVVAHSAVVTKSFGDDVIIGGNPAKVIASVNAGKNISNATA